MRGTVAAFHVLITNVLPLTDHAESLKVRHQSTLCTIIHWLVGRLVLWLIVLCNPTLAIAHPSSITSHCSIFTSGQRWNLLESDYTDVNQPPTTFQYSLFDESVDCSMGMCRLYIQSPSTQFVSQLSIIHPLIIHQAIFPESRWKSISQQSTTFLFFLSDGTFHWLESELIVALGSMECPSTIHEMQLLNSSQSSANLTESSFETDWLQCLFTFWYVGSRLLLCCVSSNMLRLVPKMIVWWMHFLTCIFRTCIFLRICETLISTCFVL